MKKSTMVIIAIVVVIFMLYRSFSSTYNNLVVMEEGVNGSWAQVENQYQRRMDLIPNLVETVKGYASHEKETFTEVANARSSVGKMQITPEILNNPQLMQKFNAAQNTLSGALSRLMVVAEKYPDLKANTNFLSLQDQLEGTENRIAVERRRFNGNVQGYNTIIRRFPTTMIAGMMGFEKKAYFESTAGAENAPKVSF
ncbi:MAG: LemA family protein [Candidatus Marinimicrobia bacterium]|nr:LemA family protein [Candidatus Neomarinimicrobiota bacterium]